MTSTFFMGEQMGTFDFAGTIDELLRRPLVGYHIRQLTTLKDKERNGELSHADEIYISDAWNKFRMLPSTEKTPEERTRANRTAAELAETKERIATLREATKRAITQRNEWEA